jgi:glutamate dehydrogenase (NAD(P)+)
MAWIKDEIGRSVGLPRELGGIPLDEIGATGIGLVAAGEAACQLYDLPLRGSRIAIQGFGAVGKHAALLFQEKGAIVVAAADSHGTVSDPHGLDVDRLIHLKNQGEPVTSYPNGLKGDTEAIISVPCDIWIPAARPDVIHENNVNLLQTKLILQGANIPITPPAEKILFKKGIHVIPDFIANAGGVICAAVEYQGGTEAVAKEVIQQKIRDNTAQVVSNSLQEQITPRDAANNLALKRVKKAMSFRR